MRILLGLSALTLATAASPPAQAQYGFPRGSYERQCTDIRMDGQMLSATCRGARGPAQSSINVLSCSTQIGVDAEGGLTCVGPGGGAPPSIRDAPPGYGVAPGPGYRPRAPYGGGYRGGGREAVALFSARDWRGRAVRIEGEAPNLAGAGLNDKVRSIRLERGSAPWIVCTDANYRGRCVTIGDSVGDTRQIGMRGTISSLRPAY